MVALPELVSESHREGFAIKIIDGIKTALFHATVEVLDQLGWLADTQRPAFALQAAK